MNANAAGAASVADTASAEFACILSIRVHLRSKKLTSGVDGGASITITIHAARYYSAAAVAATLCDFIRPTNRVTMNSTASVPSQAAS